MKTTSQKRAKKSRKPKMATLSISIEPDALARMQLCADAEQMSVSLFVRSVVMEAVQSRSEARKVATDFAPTQVNNMLRTIELITFNLRHMATTLKSSTQQSSESPRRPKK